MRRDAGELLNTAGPLIFGELWLLCGRTGSRGIVARFSKMGGHETGSDGNHKQSRRTCGAKRLSGHVRGFGNG